MVSLCVSFQPLINRREAGERCGKHELKKIIIEAAKKV
jgi:hypothetical protein